MPYKKGGGNKLQPYIPKGNGDESGEYTNKINNILLPYMGVANDNNRYNAFKCKLVGRINHCYSYPKGMSIPYQFKPFSVVKKVINGYIVSERYFNDQGLPYLDIDYTCHGNPKTHKLVPHAHRYSIDECGNLKRLKKGEKV